ncbi:hypothetical protein BvCmsOUP014_04703 [Escherichia coli]|nr:hypothetical protein BvCmsOUP014_04703 [Escherichia coli]
MPQGHRHQKRPGSDKIFHTHLQVAAGFSLFCPPFQEGKMLNTLQRRQLRKHDGYTVIFKLFCFQEHRLSLSSLATRHIINGNFSHRSKLTITGNHGDTHFSGINPRHSNRHIFHANGGF